MLVGPKISVLNLQARLGRNLSTDQQPLQPQSISFLYNYAWPANFVRPQRSSSAVLPWDVKKALKTVESKQPLFIPIKCKEYNFRVILR